MLVRGRCCVCCEDAQEFSSAGDVQDWDLPLVVRRYLFILNFKAFDWAWTLLSLLLFFFLILRDLDLERLGLFDNIVFERLLLFDFFLLGFSLRVLDRVERALLHHATRRVPLIVVDFDWHIRVVKLIEGRISALVSLVIFLPPLELVNVCKAAIDDVVTFEDASA